MSDEDLRDLERKATAENPAVMRYLKAKLRVTEVLASGVEGAQGQLHEVLSKCERAQSELETLRASITSAAGAASESRPAAVGLQNPLYHTPSTYAAPGFEFMHGDDGKCSFIRRDKKPDYWVGSEEWQKLSCSHDALGWPNVYEPSRAVAPGKEFDQEDEAYWRALVIHKVNSLANLLAQVISALKQHKIVS